MLKKQEKALTAVITDFRKEDPHIKDLGHIHYTEQYLYAMNSNEAYRLPNDTGTVTYGIFPGKYPTEFLDKLIDTLYQEHGREAAVIPTETVKTSQGNLLKIGNSFFQPKYIRRAKAILGNDMIVYPSPNWLKPMLAVSDKGCAVICPVMCTMVN